MVTILNLPMLKPLGTAPEVVVSRSSGLPFLPPIGAGVDSPVSPCRDVMNPGSFSPQRQQHVRPTLDQSMSVTLSSASHVNSDGQEQRVDKNPGQQGVSVLHLAAPAALRSSDGSFQRKDFAPVDQGTMSSVGLPALPQNFSPADQNVGKKVQAFAPWTAPAVTVDAGIRRAGGGDVPQNHNIR